MANKPISMKKIRQIIRLKQDGYSTRKISEMLGIHRYTTSKYVSQIEALGISYELLLTEEDVVLDSLFEKPKFVRENTDRLLRLQDYFPEMEKELGRVGVDKWGIWTEYKQAEPEGYTYSHFCREYKRWKQKQEVSAHFEYKAGDKALVDYTGKKLYIIDKLTGEAKAVEVFVAILGFSNYVYVEATYTQKKEDFIGAMENALHYFGGVPHGIVTDNLKSAVIRSSKYEPQLNETFESFALYYNTTILPTRSHKPKDKALVEGAVRIVYTRIFAPIRNSTFFSLSELNAEIRKLNETFNVLNFQRKDHSRKILLNQVELPELKTLPLEKYELKNFRWLTVQRNSHIYFSDDKHYYSVHYKYNRQKVKVKYTNTQIEIYLEHERIAIHRRDRKYGYTTEKEHMPSSHRFVSEWSSDFFIHWAGGIGEQTKHFIAKILASKAHPEQSYKSCIGVLGFAKKIGKERLNNACGRALDYGGDYKYDTIKRILDMGLDKEPIQLEEIPCNIPKHENIRGETYYQ